MTGSLINLFLSNNISRNPPLSPLRLRGDKGELPLKLRGDVKKNIPQIQKGGWYYDELQGSVPFTLSNDRNCKSLEISLPARIISKLHGG
jgi:hypothetical protein